MTWVDAVGWLGAFCILAGYFLNVRKILDVSSVAYLLLNLSGAVFIMINTFYLSAYPPMVLNIFWALIALDGLYKHQRQPQAPSRLQNVYTGIPSSLDDELFETLLETKCLKLERIVSQAHASPEGHWYDQSRDEWVVVLAGSAGVMIEGQAMVVLSAGDYLHLPPHQRHRVAWTQKGVDTVWLALHFNADISPCHGIVKDERDGESYS